VKVYSLVNLPLSTQPKHYPEKIYLNRQSKCGQRNKITDITRRKP